MGYPMKLVRYFIFFTLFFSKGFSQTDQQFWIDLNPYFVTSETLTLYGDLGYRFEIGDNNWNRFVFRPSIRKTLKSYNLTGGIGNFVTTEYDGVEDFVYELRPFQGIQKIWPNKNHFKVGHYLRSEQRFQWDIDEKEFSFSLRARYRIRLNYIHKTWLKSVKNYWKFYAAGEAFISTQNTNYTISEQSRITLGVERSFNRSRKFRMEVTWQRQDVFRPNLPFNSIYFRLRLYPSWGYQQNNNEE